MKVGICLIGVSCTMGYLAAPNSEAQIGEPIEIFRPELLNPTDVHVADLDNDGRMDVIINSREDGKIVWYKNNGGTFSNQRIISENEPVSAGVEAEDIDSDGDQDIIVLSNENQSLVWYENNAQSFDNRHVIDDGLEHLYQGREQNRVLTEDVNRDGNPDIILTDSDSTIVWYQNNGGSFESSTSIGNFSLYSNINDFKTGDITNNNRADLIFVLDESVAWYENGGFGYYSDSTIVATSNCLFCYYNSVDLADIDQDGDLDIITSEFDYYYFTHEIWWHENEDGSFTNSTMISDMYLYEGMIVASDIDFDGDQDIMAFGYRVISQMVWFENTDGSFSEANFFIEGEYEYYNDVEIADIDGDSDPDILHVNGRKNKIEWLNDQSYGNYERLPVSRTPSYSYMRDIAASDFTGDGMTDIAVIFTLTEQVAWLQQTEQGFTLPKVIDRTWARAIHPADMDGNGDVDLVVSTQYDSLKIYLNSGTDLGQRFSNEIVVTDTANLVRDIHTEDVDGDGDLDIITTAASLSGIVWYENQTTGFSAPKIVSENARGSLDIMTRDLDSDGDQDILAALSYSGQLAWFKNLNTSLGDRFGNKIVITDSVAAARAVDAADLDNDGDLDLLSASAAFNDNKIAWYENQGAQFGKQQLLMEPANLQGTERVKAIDLNDDGYNDVVAQHDSALIWFENDQTGGFSAHSQIDDYASNIKSFVISDINGDAAPDVIAGYNIMDRIVWYENEFTFTPIPEDNRPSAPDQFALLPNYPNPFNPTTRIEYALPEAAEVTLTIYNVLGQKVAVLVNRKMMAGNHWAKFDASDLASGVYTYQLKAGDYLQTRKMLLLR